MHALGLENPVPPCHFKGNLSLLLPFSTERRVHRKKHGKSSNLNISTLYAFLKSQTKKPKDAQQPLRNNIQQYWICKPQMRRKRLPFYFNGWAGFILFCYKT